MRTLITRLVLSVMLTFITRSALAADAPRWAPLYEPGNGGATVSLRVSPHDSRRILSGGDMLSMALSTNAGETWQSTFGFKSYEMADVTFHPTDPNVVWAGTMSGPYKSVDGGLNWTEQRSGFPPISGGTYSAAVERVLFDPNNVRRLIAIGGSSRRWAQSDSFGGVWESTDAGDTWRHIATVTNDGSTPEAIKGGVNLVAGSFLAGSSTRLAALGNGQGFYLSEDGGKTWAKHNAGLPHTNVARLATHPTDPDTLWVSLGAAKPSGEAQHLPGGIFKSTDGGRSWTSISGNLPQDRSDGYHFTAHYNALAVSPIDSNVIWTSDARWNTGVLYRTTNGGATWTPVGTKQNIGQDESDPTRRSLLDAAPIITATFAGAALSNMEADPKDPLVAYGFGTEYLLRTTDGGKSWTDITAFRPDESKKDHWRGRGFTGWCATNVVFNPYVKGQSIIQAMDAARAWISDDDLKSWRYSTSEPNPWLGGTDAAFTKDGRIYVTTGQHGDFNGILRSSDGGANWTVLSGATRGLPDAGFGKRPESNGIYAHPDDAMRVWVTVGGKLLGSTDAGERWTPIDGAPAGSVWIAADPTEAGRFYVSAKNGVYVTSDGRTFTNIGGPKPAGRGRINCDSVGNVYACQWRDGRPGVWRYDAAGRMWTRLLDEHFAFEVNADPFDPNRLALITNDDPYHDHTGATGVWLSADAGKTWAPANDQLPMLRGQAIAFDPHTPGRLVVGTFGRGFFIATWNKAFVPAGTRSYKSTEDDRLAVAPPHPAMEGSVLANGNMNDGSVVPVGWSGSWGDVVAARDTDVFRSAPASLRIDPSKAGGSGQAFQQIEGLEGKSFRLSGFVKSEGNARVNVAVQSFDEGWTKNEFRQAKYVQDETDWSEFSTSIELPEWAARSNVLLMIEGDGRAWLDDVKLTPTAPAPIRSASEPLVLLNASFDQGSDQPVGWVDHWGDAKVSRDATEGGDKPGALRVDVNGKQGQASQRITADPGTTFTIHGRVKTTGDVKVNFAIQPMAATGTPIEFVQVKYAQGTNDWAEASKQITLPAKTASFGVVLLAEGTGSAWLDDVSITAANVPVALNAAPEPAKMDPSNPLFTSPTAGKPTEPAWGFWEQHPTAWQSRHNEFLARTKQGDVGVVFLGDSITQGWGSEGKDIWDARFAPVKSVNYGIGGDSTRQVLWRIANGELDELKPKLVVLMIGTNNLYGPPNGGNDEDIAAGVLECVKAICAKLPDAKVLLLGILPRQNEYFCNRIEKINAMIQRDLPAIAGDAVTYLDLTDTFSVAPGRVVTSLFAQDELHLSSAGYAAWAEAMAPAFDALVK
ncbi:MAG TPA: GDSL-type esterase/lipase family protein [Tepidisphaeraceae bacterium]|jgi:lysophospholipase L1-like esterase|nr:GDSL-type esterase/lipase family protein [Tepidisphaeraceae bacterium]